MHNAFVPDLELWDAWTPDEMARRLEGVDARWYVVAGWALDLFLGGQTRKHEDLEIGVAEQEFLAISAALGDFELFAVGGGSARPLSESALAAYRQTWVREPETGHWRVDVIRETWDGDVWVFARDPRIRVHGDELISRSSDGIPYIRPEVALLFKAKSVRPKDNDDFIRVLPHLEGSRRAWLAEALELVHPGHRWLTAIAER